MRRTESGFSIVDFLIIIALLLIVVGMFGPYIAKSRGKAKTAAVVASSARVIPAR
jgi:competence protein ComGC